MNSKVVLVTGAASGIGYETARQFVHQGDTVVGPDRNSGNLEMVADKLGQRFIAKTCDIADIDQTKALADFIGETFGRLDVLVNNAGLGEFIPLPEMEEADYLYHYEVLVKGPMFLVKHCLPLLQKSPNASILNVSSSVAKIEVSNHHLYSTAKAAIEKFTFHLVRDFPGIRSNTILPGFIDTPIFKATGLSDAQIKDVFGQISQSVPCGRVGKPEDIANCIRFLSSEQATYINGASIVIDGGWLRSADWRI